MTPLPDIPEAELLDRYFAGESDAVEIARVREFLERSSTWNKVDSIEKLNFSDSSRTGVSTEISWKRLQESLIPNGETGDFTVGDSPVSQRASLQRAKDAAFGTPFFRALRFGAVSLIVLIAIVVTSSRYGNIPSFISQSDESGSSATREYVVQRGERATIQLVDGTEVILGPESRLSYPESFNSSTRTVEISGSAYFNIADDPRRPFVVLARNAAIQELGTKFSVIAYDDEPSVDVVVVEGRVAMRNRDARPQTGIVLNKGDAAALDERGLTTVSKGVDLDASTAWIRKQVIFENESLGTVLRVLERWYDVDFSFENIEVSQRRIALTVNTESLPEILMQLSKVLNLNFERKGKNITVMEIK